MKKCPFCEFENEDSANECISCGNALLIGDKNLTQAEEVVNADSEKEEWAVFISNVYRNKAALKSTLKKELKYKGSELKKVLGDGLITGLSFEKADRLAKMLKDDCSFVKVIDINAVATIKDAIAQNYGWRVKLLAWGQYKEAAVRFFFQYMFGAYLGDEFIEQFMSTRKKDAWNIVTTYRLEAEELISKLENLGCEAEIVKIKIKRHTNWLAKLWYGKYSIEEIE